MSETSYKPCVACGNVYDPILPNALEQSDPPIVLGDVSVNTINIKKSCVLIKYSEFINFTLIGLNPKLIIVYRLVRKDRYSKYSQILQEWNNNLLY